MTIKEMVKKVEAYNDVAEVIRGTKLELRMCVGFSMSTKVSNLSELRKYMKREFIDELTSAILDRNDYEFDETKEITYIDFLCRESTEKVSFDLCAVW